MTILAFARSTSGFYFGELLAGLTREVARAGGRVVVVQTLDPGDVADAVVSTPGFDLPVAWDRVDGAVAVSLAAGGAHLQSLRDHGVPVVLASSRVEGFDAPLALPDNHGGTSAAVDHLVAHGHSRIGFVGNLGQTDMRERYAAFREALARHGLPHDHDTFFEAPDNSETGGIAAARLVARAPRRPTALMVATDRNALGLFEGLADHGVDVPGDVAVVAFDNIEAGTFSSPTLSSVSQRFDMVGALAGRMVVAAVRGEEQGHAPRTPETVVVAARQSCGCSDGPLAPTVPDLVDTGERTASAGMVRRELTELLVTDGDADGVRGPGSVGDVPAPHTGRAGRTPAVVAHSPGIVAQDPGVAAQHPGLGARHAGVAGRHVGLTGPAPAPDQARRVVEAAVRLVEGATAPTAAEVRELVAALRLLRNRPDILHRVANTLIEHVGRASWGRERAAAPAPVTVPGQVVVAALWQLQAEAYLRRSQTQERLLTEQFRLSASLLDAAGPDARTLRWLSGTHVRAGVLALWADGPERRRLDVVGVYDPDGTLPDLRGEVDVALFPPPPLTELAAPSAREACFVVPVRTRERDWGLLAVVGAVDTTSSRDTYLHWAQLLCAAFDGEALAQAVRASEERYAYAAAASNDGLWEWDLRSGGIYASERCRAVLGLPATGPLTVETWRATMHEDDLDAVLHALDQARSGADRAVEVEYRVRSADGGFRWVRARGMGVANDGGPVQRLVGSLSDIHPRKELEEQLRRGALYDPLTGLPNRRLFHERLSSAVAEAQRDAAKAFAVVFMDLDGFKLVNDSLGHLMGDRLLKVIGERLRTVVRNVDTAARFGGDEFAVLLTGLPLEAVAEVVERIQVAVAAPVRLGEHEVSVTASVGITTSDVSALDPEDVLRDADTAMYHAKGAERGTAARFDVEMHARASGRLRARGELRTALAEGQFVVHYQPIVAIADAVVHHVEALVRWEHPERGLLTPAHFLPEMEEHGTVVALGEWLVDEVCRQVAQWRAAGHDDVTVSVNLSHREFWSEGLVPLVRDALARHDVPARCLVLEITETVVMTDEAAARTRLTALRDLGLRLHIDDFGTGQSSLHALRSLPVDALKIDGSFVNELGREDETADLVGIIVAMGRTLGLEVVAECVETLDQAERLTALGCRIAQGWLYARALPGDEVGRLLGASVGPMAAEAVTAAPALT
jgi:diguanylate cyclase (GGDEF)-like protein/PAS domain S-box-containing protein